MKQLIEVVAHRSRRGLAAATEYEPKSQERQSPQVVGRQPKPTQRCPSPRSRAKLGSIDIVEVRQHLALWVSAPHFDAATATVEQSVDAAVRQSLHLRPPVLLPKGV